jgi:hypothetical protein
MALTPSSIAVAADVEGEWLPRSPKPVVTYKDGSNNEVQAVVLLDSNGSIITPASETGLYTVRQDDVSASVSYFGWAAAGAVEAGAVWRIMKKSVSGTVTSYTWADGKTSFDNVWNNRASLSYS